METATIIIRGRKGQTIFFDDNDRKKFSDICGYLPDHLSNDLRTYERCGRATKIDFSQSEAVVHIEAWDWNPTRIANFICLCYDSYIRLRYQRTGPQTVHEITKI